MILLPWNIDFDSDWNKSLDADNELVWLLFLADSYKRLLNIYFLTETFLQTKTKLTDEWVKHTLEKNRMIISKWIFGNQPQDLRSFSWSTKHKDDGFVMTLVHMAKSTCLDC